MQVMLCKFYVQYDGYLGINPGLHVQIENDKDLFLGTFTHI